MTEQTFDAYLYQLVESMQKFISQIITSKSPVRSAEDVDKDTLSFAKVKMLATGDDKFCPMTLGGITYTKKTNARQMLLTVCKEHPQSKSAEIGSYHGFKLKAYYDAVNSTYCQNLCGKARHKVELCSNALGNLTRIESELSKPPAKLTAAKTRKEETISQLKNAKVEVEKPFAFKEKLKEKSDSLNSLNIELNLDEKDSSAIDTEPEQDEELPGKKIRDLERYTVCTFVLWKSGHYNRYR